MDEFPFDADAEVVRHFGVEMRLASLRSILEFMAKEIEVSHGCNTLQYTATHCTTLQHVSLHSFLESMADEIEDSHDYLQHTATYCNILQHTATYCNTLQYVSLRFIHTAVACSLNSHMCVYAFVNTYMHMYTYV